MSSFMHQWDFIHLHSSWESSRVPERPANVAGGEQMGWMLAMQERGERKKKSFLYTFFFQFSSMRVMSNSVQSLSKTLCCPPSRDESASSLSSSSSSSSLSLSGPILVLPKPSAGEHDPLKSPKKGSRPMQRSPPQASLPRSKQLRGSVLRVWQGKKKKIK